MVAMSTSAHHPMKTTIHPPMDQVVFEALQRSTTISLTHSNTHSNAPLRQFVGCGSQGRCSSIVGQAVVVSGGKADWRQQGGTEKEEITQIVPATHAPLLGTAAQEQHNAVAYSPRFPSLHSRINWPRMTSSSSGLFLVRLSRWSEGDTVTAHSHRERE